MGVTVLFYKLFQFKDDLAPYWNAIVAMATQLKNSYLLQLDS